MRTIKQCLALSTLLLAVSVSAEQSTPNNCSGQLQADKEVVEIAKSTAITSNLFLFEFASGLTMVTPETISGGTEAFHYHLAEATKSAKYGKPATGVILKNKVTGILTLGLVTTVPIKDSDDSDVCVADGLQEI